MSRDPLIINTDCGLFCPAGGFYIDAWRPVPRNVVTHAHADHARAGSEPQLVTADINTWWRQNQELGRTSILIAYSPRKAQRVMSSLDASIGPILLHGAVYAMVQAYRESGIELPDAEHATAENAKANRGKAMVIAPPLALNSPWIRKFAPFSTGIASGWMQVRGFRRRKFADRGFALSDHVDWPGLLQTIEQTGAEQVIATHGYTGPLVRYLAERGVRAMEFETQFSDEDEEQLAEDAASPESN